MIWADKIVAGVAGLVVLALLFVHNVGTPGAEYPVPSTGEVFSAFIEIIGIVAAKVLLPLWLFLRLIDFLCGGPARRRGRVIGHVLPH